MNEKHQVRTAILVDGGFYRKRATSLFGKKSPVERAEELSQYCYAHLRDKYESRYLYRIFCRCVQHSKTLSSHNKKELPSIQDAE